MRAAVMRKKQIITDEIPEPVPADGEVLVRTLACGICGSDLHALKHGHEMVQTSIDTGGSFVMDLSRDVVMGHEFCAEILDHGPGTSGRFKAGTRVCSVPVTARNGVPLNVGYSNDVPGGYAERMVLLEEMLIPVPNGLESEVAALTEPMAVGLHAVAKSGITQGEVPLVIGCGPVGLAVISALKMLGVGPVIAADFSPARRKLAEAQGADVVIDPATTSPYESWAAAAAIDNPVADGLFGGMTHQQGVFFECVGVPGLIGQLMAGAPRDCRIVVVGVCMQVDEIRPLVGINKEINLSFVLAYSPEEFADTLRRIADGEIDVSRLITGRVGLGGVAGAFEALADPELHAKIMVDPSIT